MRCRRCHRFMAVDSYFDLGKAESPLWLRAWRCGNCGNVYKPEIFLNRVVHRNRWYRALSGLVDKRRTRDELMALTG